VVPFLGPVGRLTMLYSDCTRGCGPTLKINVSATLMPFPPVRLRLQSDCLNRGILVFCGLAAMGLNPYPALHHPLRFVGTCDIANMDLGKIRIRNVCCCT
jgi:hypothetical protein